MTRNQKALLYTFLSFLGALVFTLLMTYSPAITGGVVLISFMLVFLFLLIRNIV